MSPYIVLDKQVGETPLSCAEAWREKHPEYQGVPLAYAGRLDPMASGKLLVLIGEECKRQTEYHGLDKAYEFSVLFGITSDTLDVLGRLTPREAVPTINPDTLETVLPSFFGDIELPYPHFSAKTVQGKPLHVWTLENRLHEITLPTITTTIHTLTLDAIETVSRAKLVAEALEKVNSIPEVTDQRKALGNDFRRVDVRRDWNEIRNNDSLPTEYSIARFTCIASSGTYMRTLASEIAKKLGTIGLAFRIHRTHIGTYDNITRTWSKEYS